MKKLLMIYIISAACVSTNYGARHYTDEAENPESNRESELVSQLIEIRSMISEAMESKGAPRSSQYDMSQLSLKKLALQQGLDSIRANNSHVKNTSGSVAKIMETRVNKENSKLNRSEEIKKALIDHFKDIHADLWRVIASYDVIEKNVADNKDEQLSLLSGQIGQKRKESQKSVEEKINDLQQEILNLRSMIDIETDQLNLRSLHDRLAESGLEMEALKTESGQKKGRVLANYKITQLTKRKESAQLKMEDLFGQIETYRKNESIMFLATSSLKEAMEKEIDSQINSCLNEIEQIDKEINRLKSIKE